MEIKKTNKSAKSAKTQQQPQSKKENKKEGSNHDQGLNIQLNRRISASVSSEQVEKQDLTEEQFQMKLKKIRKNILYHKEHLYLQNAKKEQEEEKEYQYLQKIPRIQELLRLIDQQDERLNFNLDMSPREREQILKQIQEIYNMQINLAKRKKQKQNILIENQKMEKNNKLFQRYLPLYQSLKSSSKAVKELLQYQYQCRSSNLSTAEKQYHILNWIKQQERQREERIKERIKQQGRQREERIKERIKQQRRQREERIQQYLKYTEERIEKRINSISVELDTNEKQQFKFKRKLTKTTDEDEKEEIEINLFSVSLKIKNNMKYLDKQKKDLQKKQQQIQLLLQNILLKGQEPVKQIDLKNYQNKKSPLQIKWQIQQENIKEQKVQIEQRWNKNKKYATDKRQKSIHRLEQCFSKGRNITTKAKQIQSTRFYSEDSKDKYKDQLSQMEYFLQSRKKLFANIQSYQNRLQEEKEQADKIKKKLQQLKEKISKGNQNNEAVSGVKINK